jgi:hypothetical protein
MRRGERVNVTTVALRNQGDFLFAQLQGDGEMPEPEPKPAVTPEEPTPPAPEPEKEEGEKFDAARAFALIEKLRAEIKELKPKVKQAEELAAAEAKRKEAEMTELQKAQAELEKTKAELKQAHILEMRRAAAAKVAAELKVEFPVALVDRLKGETPEELETDAKAILEALPKASKSPPKVEPTNPGPNGSPGETVAQARARIYGTGIDVLNPEWGKTHGGGVIMPEKPLSPPST